MLKILLVVHRYLAVAVGLLMALWCLSGFVMMYQPYPELTEAEQLQGLAPLQLAGCCRTDFLPEDSTPLRSFRIEMQLGQPVFRQRGMPFDLASGTPLRRPTQEMLLRIAAEHATRRGLAGKPQWLGQIDVDQWTLENARRNQPVQHIALRDAAGTELYLNGASGEIFQDTTRRERILNWFGAIPHWLYPLALRRHGPAWTQVVIWTSVIGCFLAATGLYVGISRLQRRRSDGALASPFRGWWYWHHIAGLAFGVLALSWVFSGLLTMNPWGLLEGSDIGARVQPQLTGSAPMRELRQFLRAAPAQLAAGEYARLHSQPFGGHLFVIAQRADGSSTRLNASAEPAPFDEAQLREGITRLDTGLVSLELLRAGDQYYYSHKEQVELPVWRAILGDDQRTRLYISPTTAEYRIVDRDARDMRWLERGLHGMDFSGLRKRPIWDVVTLLLLAGVTTLCITGAWMAIQRVRRDFSRK